MNIIFYAIFGYIMLLFGFYVYQRRLIYQPSSNKITVNHPKLKPVFLTTNDNLNILAWYHQATNNQPTIIYFPGKAGTIADRVAGLAHFIDQDYGLLLISYRGYAGNQGFPSEHGLYEDARAGLNFLQKQLALSKVVIFGESLGTGIAIQMALEFPNPLLVLQSPYTSIVEMAKHRYPWLPLAPLVKDVYNSIAKASEIKQHTIIIHGKKDKVIPFSMAKKLYANISAKKQLLVMDNAGHEDVLNNKAITTISKAMELL